MTPLPAAAQRRLVQAAQSGDQGAREQLLQTNQAFLQVCARNFSGRGVEHQDLVQEGAIGLLHAIDRFDLQQPVQFLTYAAYWIRQAMGRACERDGTTARYGLRIPAHVLHAIPRVQQAEQKFQAERGRAPEVQELAQRLELSPDCVVMAQTAIGRGAAARLGDEEQDHLEQIADPQPGPAQQLQQTSQRQALQAALRQLPSAQQQVLAARFGLDDQEPQSERMLSERWGYSRAQLQSLRADGLAALREQLTTEPQPCGHLLSAARLPGQLAQLSGGRLGRWPGGWWLAQGDQLWLSLGQGELQPLARLLHHPRVRSWAARLPLRLIGDCPRC